jgi:hypothetical protein
MSAVRSIKVSTGSVHVSTFKYLSLASSCLRDKQLIGHNYLWPRWL